jgi:LysM repeat protein
MSSARKLFSLSIPAILLLAACSGGTGTPAPLFPSGPQPYHTVTADASTPDPAQWMAATAVVPPTTTPFVYAIQQGDTLSTIAERHGVSLDALLAANPGVEPTALRIGQELLIPTGASSVTGDTAPTPALEQVEQAGCLPGADGGLWCYALVRNSTPETIENLTAQITLLDPGSQATLATQAAYLPLNILPSGQALPLTASFPPGLPADAHPIVQVLSGVRLLSSDPRYLPAGAQNVLTRIDWPGRTAQVSGMISLGGDDAASQVWVAAVAYDARGHVTGLRRWQSSGPLQPGGSLPFQVTVYSLGGDVDHVEIVIEARP